MHSYVVITTEFALSDLESARQFYESQSPQLGDYFYDALIADIESLHLYAGIHVKAYGFYKLLSKRFPYAIYYDISREDVARVIGVLDQRRKPMHHYLQLLGRT